MLKSRYLLPLFIFVCIGLLGYGKDDLVFSDKQEKEEDTHISLSLNLEKSNIISTSRILSDVNRDQSSSLDTLIGRVNTQREREQIYALIDSYAPHYITAIAWKDNDIEFTVRGKKIYYAGGRMLSSLSLEQRDIYNRIFYPYQLAPLRTFFDELPIPQADFSKNYVRASDFQIALVGSRPEDIESDIKEYLVLGMYVRLHPMVGKAAMQASQDILVFGKKDAEVKRFVSGLRTISGYVNRKVQESTNISMHSFGLALDFIPRSYNGKMAYWVWTKAQRPKQWSSLLLNDRWLIPDKIVMIMESHGFIWGGKWPHYDTIHFEYRPELISYAKIREKTGSIGHWNSTVKNLE